MAFKRPDDLPELDDSDRDMLATYRRARVRLRVGLIALLGGVVVAIVFDTPKRWGDGEIAQIIRGLAWLGVVIGGITMHVANGYYGEARGYLRGRFGDELAQKLLASRSRPAS